MCLALPGKIVAISHAEALPMADVDFSGISKKVCLAYTPEAKAGDWVIVHVGFAIALLDVKEAQKTLELCNEIRR